MRATIATIILILGLCSFAQTDAAQTAPSSQNDAVAAFYAGHAALQQGNAKAAIKDFSKALEIGNLDDTQTAYVHHYRAIAYQRLGRQQEAIDDYTQALALGTLPKRVQAAVYYNRAIALDHLGNYERAIKDYTAAIALKPDYAEAYMNRGNAYRKLGDNDHALQDYEASASYGNPIKQLPYYGEGLVLEAKGDKEGAFKAFQTALALAPDFEPAKLKVEGYEAAGMKPTLVNSTTQEARNTSGDNGEGVTAATKKAVSKAPPAKPVVADAAPPARMAAPTAKAPLEAKVAAPKPAQRMAEAAPIQPTKAEPTKPQVSGPAPGRAAHAPPPAVSAAVPQVAPPSAPKTAAASAKPAPTKTASIGPAGGAFRVQLASYPSETMARTQADSISAKFSNLLAGLTQHIQRADLGKKGVYYRLQFGSFATKTEAAKQCSRFKARGQACIVVIDRTG